MVVFKSENPAHERYMPSPKKSSSRITKQGVMNAIRSVGVPVHPKILKALAGLRLGDGEEYPNDLWDQGGAEWNAPYYEPPASVPTEVKKEEVSLKELIDDVRSTIINGNMHITHDGRNLNISNLLQRIQQELGAVRSARAAAVAEGKNPREETYKVVLKDEGTSEHLVANKHESIAIMEDMHTFSMLVSSMARQYETKIQELPKFNKKPPFMDGNAYPLVKYAQWLRSTMRAFYTILRAHLKHNYKHDDGGNQARPAATEEKRELLRKMLQVVTHMKQLKRDLRAAKRPAPVYGPHFPPHYHGPKRRRTSRKLRGGLQMSKRRDGADFPSNPYLHMT